MTAQQSELPDVVADPRERHNEVRLVGRLAADPRLRQLAGGESVWTLRVVVVERPPRPPGKSQRRQRVDHLECAIWSGRLRKGVEKWAAGDLVELSGALRRRFFRAGGTTASRVEVEVTGGRRVRKAGSGPGRGSRVAAVPDG
jgi:single-strand DNA-binding protein